MEKMLDVNREEALKLLESGKNIFLTETAGFAYFY